MSCSLAAGFILNAAPAGNLVVGANVVNPLRASVADQNILIGELKAAHVPMIRAPLTPDDKSIDFIKRVYAQGIKIELQLSPQYPANAPSRPYQKEQFPNMWGGHPLSTQTRSYPAFIFNLYWISHANGIALAGLELGNEINWTAFNPEFPLPGKGINFGLQDLSHDPEGKQIARGYLQYLKILAVLKDVRDHSKLNQHAPIILAGLADDGAEGLRPKSQTDSVSITPPFSSSAPMDSISSWTTTVFIPIRGKALPRAAKCTWKNMPSRNAIPRIPRRANAAGSRNGVSRTKICPAL